MEPKWNYTTTQHEQRKDIKHRHFALFLLKTNTTKEHATGAQYTAWMLKHIAAFKTLHNIDDKFSNFLYAEQSDEFIAFLEASE